MPFLDRKDAGRRLAGALIGLEKEGPVVLALPRGGVPVAAEVAIALHAPLDLLIVRKIGCPFQPELAMGAVVDGSPPITVRNEDIIRAAGVTEAEFDEVRREQMAEIERRRRRYLAGRRAIAIGGRTVIVIDDGLATGATMRAALRALLSLAPKTIVLAIPVAPTETLEEMRQLADKVVCLEEYGFFGAIGAYYDDFRQVGDEELIAILERFASAKDASSENGAG
jgi:putative phosphoribosyl transferase